MDGSHRNSSPPWSLLSLSAVPLVLSAGRQHPQFLTSLLTLQHELPGWQSHNQVDVLHHRQLLCFLNSVPFLLNSSATPSSRNHTTPAAFSLPSCSLSLSWLQLTLSAQCFANSFQKMTDQIKHDFLPVLPLSQEQKVPLSSILSPLLFFPAAKSTLPLPLSPSPPPL